MLRKQRYCEITGVGWKMEPRQPTLGGYVSLEEGKRYPPTRLLRLSSAAWRWVPFDCSDRCWRIPLILWLVSWTLLLQFLPSKALGYSVQCVFISSITWPSLDAKLANFTIYFTVFLSLTGRRKSW